jgi:hypothetical protein
MSKKNRFNSKFNKFKNYATQKKSSENLNDKSSPDRADILFVFLNKKIKAITGQNFI